MPQKPPEFYTALGPFREIFAQGLPILMYHKLGARPRGVRLKGLYVSTRLFARQMRELRDAGYRSAMLDDLPAQCAPRAELIAITFDDGYVNVLKHAIRPLAESGLRAIQYIVADAIGGTNDWDVAENGEAPERLMDHGHLREWLAAGHAIGSHTLSHAWLTRISPSQAREEIVASKRKLEDRFGVAVDHFCYPYGDWNETVRDLVMEAGYRSACTTRWGINEPGANAFELKRFQARYLSWGLKGLRARLRR